MGMGGNGNGNGFMGMGGNENRNSPSRTPLVSTVSGHPQLLAFLKKGKGLKGGERKGERGRRHCLIFT